MIRFILPAVLAVGCAGGFAQADLDRQFKLTKHHFESHVGRSVDLAAPIKSVTTSQASLTCPQYEVGKCAGTYTRTDDGWVVRLREAPCVPKSSWAHEVLHLLADAAWGDADPKHERSELWDGDGSVEALSNVAGIFEGMCE